MMLEKDLEKKVMEMGYAVVEEHYIELFDNQVDIGCGVVDVLGITDENEFFVFELKRNKIDGNALVQLLYYLSYLTQTFPNEIFNVF